jgi:hypothetical protein
MKDITHFKSEAALKRFAKKAGLKFSGAIACNDESAEAWVKDCRKRGQAVVSMANYALGEPAYLCFWK